MASLASRPFPFRSTDRFQCASHEPILKAIGVVDGKGLACETTVRLLCRSDVQMRTQVFVNESN